MTKQTTYIRSTTKREGIEGGEVDFIQTPAIAVVKLFNALDFTDCNDAWEPACGKGAISKVLIEYNLKVKSTDLVNRGYGDSKPLDFLNYKGPYRPDLIITNPPYSLMCEFIEHSLKLSLRKVAMLLPVIGLSNSQKRAKCFAANVPQCIVLFTKKIPYLDGDGNAKPSLFAHMWAVWDKTDVKQGLTKILWV